MGSTNRQMTEAMNRLEISRRQLETRFGDLQRSLEREVGWFPRIHAWALPIVALTCGLAAAGALTTKRRRKQVSEPAEDAESR